MKDEALKLVLEALKIARDQIVDPEYAPIGWSVCRLDEVLANGQQARAAPVQEPVAWVCYRAPGKRGIDFEESDINGLPIGTLLYTTPPAQPAPVQEPVAYDKTELNCFAQNLYDQKMREGKRGHYESMFHVIHQCIKKVAPPPAAQRQWVGLKDEDIEQEFGFIDELLRDCVHRTEAKLKAKNSL